jgi:hypothetical protein
MSNDVTEWVVQEYCKNREKWMYCLGTNSKEDAIDHYNLLESMYPNTPHKVVEIKHVKTVTTIIGYYGDKVVR